MNRYGLKIKINGEVVSNAGFDKDNYVLTGGTTFVKRANCCEDYYFNIGGLDSDEDEHVDWYRTVVKVGDVITMEVIDGPFDPPNHRYKNDLTPEEIIQNKIDFYNKLKEELKGHIEIAV
ncbi:hypothetical protein [Sphingobacterium paucimobilis]|uniref:Uncharacterized protein n=1 Tax=Sphingobacterium paucimobilis HER1398 TaxID=1346330 RepID=U2J5Y1_9SPHI|nr:hypothetical protein [Sphingobacterium paucimobilis]ERJ58038.1 hypothetical protein M472_04600 [Sphingobacterium paucimobilis HER1398]